MAASNGVRFALVAAAIALAFLAQALLRSGRPLWASAFFLAAIAAFTFAATDIPAAARWRERTSGPPRPRRSLRHRLSAWTAESRFGAACAAVSAVSAFVSLSAFASGPPNTAGWVMFGVSAVSMLAAITAIDGRWTPLVRRLRCGKPFAVRPLLLYEVAALCGVLLLARAVRLHDLRDLPVGLWYDEAANLSVAAAIAMDPGSAPVFATTLPTLYLLPVAALTNLLGDDARGAAPGERGLLAGRSRGGLPAWAAPGGSVCGLDRRIRAGCHALGHQLQPDRDAQRHDEPRNGADGLPHAVCDTERSAVRLRLRRSGPWAGHVVLRGVQAVPARGCGSAALRHPGRAADYPAARGPAGRHGHHGAGHGGAGCSVRRARTGRFLRQNESQLVVLGSRRLGRQSATSSTICAPTR